MSPRHNLQYYEKSLRHRIIHQNMKLLLYKSQLFTYMYMKEKKYSKKKNEKSFII